MTTTNTPTPAEKAFLTMCKMVGMVTAIHNGPDHPWLVTPNQYGAGRAGAAFADHDLDPNNFPGRRGHTELEAAAFLLADHPNTHFPIVASTFATLVEERPELREHYDRAKQAWEASQ